MALLQERKYFIYTTATSVMITEFSQIRLHLSSFKSIFIFGSVAGLDVRSTHASWWLNNIGSGASERTSSVRRRSRVTVAASVSQRDDVIMMCTAVTWRERLLTCVVYVTSTENWKFVHCNVGNYCYILYFWCWWMSAVDYPSGSKRVPDMKSLGKHGNATRMFIRRYCVGKYPAKLSHYRQCYHPPNCRLNLHWTWVGNVKNDAIRECHFLHFPKFSGM